MVVHGDFVAVEDVVVVVVVADVFFFLLDCQRQFFLPCHRHVTKSDSSPSHRRVVAVLVNL